MSTAILLAIFSLEWILISGYCLAFLAVAIILGSEKDCPPSIELTYAITPESVASLYKKQDKWILPWWSTLMLANWVWVWILSVATALTIVESNISFCGFLMATYSPIESENNKAAPKYKLPS